MSDLISRQAAIDLWEKYHPTIAVDAMQYDAELRQLPSAQPERLTDDDFETIRIHLNAYKEKLCNQHRWKEAEEYQRIIDRFMAFASAQPDLSEYSDKLWRSAYERGKRDAQAERKTGKWVKPLLVTNTDRVRCSECSAMYDWYTQTQYYNFCPNCGARMEKGEEHDRQM